MKRAKLQLTNLRPGTSSDIPFIYNSWLKSFREYATPKIPDVHYFRFERDFIDIVLKDATVLIACDVNDPDQIYGYAVVSHETLHYVYVKVTFRRLGIASQLLADHAITHISHVTKDILKLMKALGVDWALERNEP